jgi:mono/diheme cytochrome c family protein
MGRELLLVGLAVAAFGGCATGESDNYEMTSVVMPEGQPAAGRQAFADLGCPACHAVSWETGWPEPAPAVRGPDLGRKLSVGTTGALASSIIAPSHVVPSEYRKPQTGGKSPMTDFTRTMTVRQLIDIVAYLRSQGEGTDAGE